MNIGQPLEQILRQEMDQQVLNTLALFPPLGDLHTIVHPNFTTMCFPPGVKTQTC